MPDVMKTFLKFLLAFTVVMAIAIVVVAVCMFSAADDAAFARYRELMSTALLPTFTAMLTFIGGAGVLNSLVQAANNAVLTAKGQPPVPVQMFSWF